MKTVRMLVILVVTMMGLAGVARSQTSTDVYGADDPAVDVQAVQDAVDTYDKVYLHGTFNFEDSVVYITRSVEILGEETDDYGWYKTRIVDGGYGAFSSQVNPSAEIVVRDIEFDGPEAALHITTSERFEFTGCSIKNIDASWGGMGIEMNSDRVTGDVLIKGNHFDISSRGTWSWGFFCQSIYADVEVVGNTVENFSVTGLWINSAGNIEITDNTITAGPAVPSDYRNGILVGSWYLPSGNRGNIKVTDNKITTGGHPMDQGITAEDQEQELRAVCKVEDNVITYVDGSLYGSGILVLNHTSNWTFKDNTIDGGGHELLASIALYPGIAGELGTQEGNVFIDNDVFDADFGISCVFIDGSAQASDNEFVDNEFEYIGADGFIVDGDSNLLLENEFKHVTGDGIILKGDYNTVIKNKFDDIGGQHIVDEGVDNVIEDND